MYLEAALVDISTDIAINQSIDLVSYQSHYLRQFYDFPFCGYFCLVHVGIRFELHIN